MDRERKLYYYKHIVKRHLNDISTNINLAKNEMERNYYRTAYAAQLSIYAKALNVQKKNLEKCICNNQKSSNNKK